MPAYSTCRLAELQQLCAQRNIEFIGKRKAELIALLEHDDDNILYRTNDSDEDDDEIVIRNYDNDVENDEQADDDDDTIVDVCNNDDDDDEFYAAGEFDDVNDVNDVFDRGEVSNNGMDVHATPGGESGRAATQPPTFPAMGGRNPRTIEMEIRLERERRETRKVELNAQREMRELDLAFERERLQRGDVRSNSTIDEVTKIKHLLPSMNDGDALTFFMSFERVCELNNVDRAMWGKLLVPQLTQQAMKVYLRLTPDQARDYDTAKQSILNYYKLDAQRYLKEFRSLRRTGRDTYAMTLNKLRDLQQAYYKAKNITTFEELSDAFLLEQMINTLPNSTREFVWAKQPKTAEDCARQADLSYEVSRINSTIPTYSTGSADATRFANGGGMRSNAPFTRPQATHPRPRSTIGANLNNAAPNSTRFNNGGARQPIPQQNQMRGNGRRIPNPVVCYR